MNHSSASSVSDFLARTESGAEMSITGLAPPRSTAPQMLSHSDILKVSGYLFSHSAHISVGKTELTAVTVPPDTRYFSILPIVLLSKDPLSKYDKSNPK